MDDEEAFENTGEAYEEDVEEIYGTDDDDDEPLGTYEEDDG